MLILKILLESLGLVVGSIAGAVAVCWMAWALFGLVRHPQWGPLVVVIALALIFPKGFHNSELVRTTIVFASVAAVALFFTGGDTRPPRTSPRHKSLDEQQIARLAKKEKDMPFTLLRRKYPVLIACMGEARHPNVREVKSVAKRILHEAFPEHEGQRQDGTRLYRHILLAARATLGLTPVATMRQEPDG
ncbi:MAG TPA: hypothetical protein VF503_14120 [Sphingobium sp.]|uniref:hypothetical protein n=1 Tax=Sphingobium sp. TaxID=1912891 RepID=UPI002ED2C84E